MTKESRKVGRPTKYKAEYAEQAYKLTMLGFIDAELAEFFEVDESTINNWKHGYPEFLESIKKGKSLADAEVASKLYHRAIGYSHDDEDIRAVNGEIVITPTKKHYPPDPTSGIFWLRNRQRGKWSNDPVADDTETIATPVQIVVNVQDARKHDDQSEP